MIQPSRAPRAYPRVETCWRTATRADTRSFNGDRAALVLAVMGIAAAAAAPLYQLRVAAGAATGAGAARQRRAPVRVAGGAPRREGRRSGSSFGKRGCRGALPATAWTAPSCGATVWPHGAGSVGRPAQALARLPIAAVRSVFARTLRSSPGWANVVTRSDERGYDRRRFACTSAPTKPPEARHGRRDAVPALAQPGADGRVTNGGVVVAASIHPGLASGLDATRVGTDALGDHRRSATRAALTDVFADQVAHARIARARA